MIPTPIPPSEVLTNMALAVVAELNATRGQSTITLHRGHLIMLAGSLTDTAERVEMLEQSDRSLDAMGHELKLARADAQRLQVELDGERYRRSLAEVALIREAGDGGDNIIDIAEFMRREQGGRS